MDLNQVKLTKTEWSMIEVPVTEQERNILQLIMEGYGNVTIKKNNTQTMFSFTKIPYSADMDERIYKTYFWPEIQNIARKYGAFGDLAPVPAGAAGGALKRADSIRLENMASTVQNNKSAIFEYVLLDSVRAIAAGLHSKKEIIKPLYTLIQITRSAITLQNATLNTFIGRVIRAAMESAGGEHHVIRHIVENAADYIEKNPAIIRYADIELYQHQKELFSVFSRRRAPANLVLYIAPTGTGKTLSPLGLAQQYRVIFVCVARHVGLALARAAISINRKIAFAFGCETAGDIRLHYFAAKEYTRNTRSGMIHKVDNSEGEKVEIMICDIKSYLCAMRYMMSFNSAADIITYWDEPTITLDCAEHELHPVIAQNWRENEIPNMVLSCATLPQQEEIADIPRDFAARFAGAETYTISSFECKKSVALVTKAGTVAAPHNMFSTKEDLAECAEHCWKNRALLKYIDLEEVTKFIRYMERHHHEPRVADYFAAVREVTMTSIKLYYLELLRAVDGAEWPAIYQTMNRAVVSRWLGAGAHIGRASSGGAAAPVPTAGILVTTTDAYTLTDGPTIYLTEDTERIGLFYLQQSQIPREVLGKLHATITKNTELNAKLSKLRRDVEDALSKESNKENKMAANHRLPPAVQKMMAEIDGLMTLLGPVSLDKQYIPNSVVHQMKFNKVVRAECFTSHIEEPIVEQIVNLAEVPAPLKLLLLMGIGVFGAAGAGDEYLEIMKKLAYEQRLYLIIASSDYIYGTNYSFCHGIIGRDLCNMTQQKTIQAIGRIGRLAAQQDYTLRFRDDEILRNLFLPSRGANLEAENMVRLFVG